MSPPILEIRDLHASYGQDLPVVADVSLDVHAGEWVSIIGPNGAGKSTLLKAVLGLVPKVRGSMLVQSEPVQIQTRSVIAAGVGYVPQGHQVFPQLSVRENLEMGCFWLDAREARRALDRVLDLLPQLHPLLRRKAGVLSGGEQQLVSFGRALTAGPRILLVDEPSAGLSPRNADLIYGILTELRGRGFGIVMVEQNARRALELSDRGLVLDLGRVRFAGPSVDLLADPRVRRSYLGGAD